MKARENQSITLKKSLDPKKGKLKPSYRKALFLFAKVTVSATIIFFLVSKIDIGKVMFFFKNIRLLEFSVAISINLSAILISSYRLRLFIPRAMPAGKLFSINLIGGFFNNVLPGSTGGDAIKFFYIYRHTGEGVTTAGSVFMDRLSGLTAIILIGFTATMANLSYLRGTGIDFFVPAVTAVFFISTFFIFSMKLGKRFSMVSKFYEYFHLYIRQKKTITVALALSIVLQTLSIFGIYIVSRSLGVDVAFIHCLIFVPIIAVIMAVPISISGLGLREGAFVFLFGLAGVNGNASLALSFGWFLSVVISSLPGLVLYFVLRPEKGLQTITASQNPMAS